MGDNTIISYYSFYVQVCQHADQFRERQLISNASENSNWAQNVEIEYRKMKLNSIYFIDK